MITIKDKELEKVKIPLNSVYTPIIPCVLDGNLSFLEMVWKLLYHINIIVDSVNANHGDIEDLAQAINAIDADKLSVMWVEIDVTVKPIKANKTFAEIAEGMRKGIVFVTVKQGGTIIAVPVFANDNIISFFFVDNKSSTTIQIKSDESVTIEEYNFAAENRSVHFYEDVTFNNIANFNKHTQFHETTKFYTLITANSGITVPTATAASGRNLAANLEYVGNACSETLTAAKSYSDTQDTAVQKAATIYTNTKCGETLATAKKYADTQDETTLSSAKTYTDSKFAHVEIVKNADGTITTANTFSMIYLNITRGVVVDVKFSSENNRNSTYIMRNTIITPTKLTFIGYDESATLHTCTIDSDNNITYT
jgi:hypothetical protein